jgi:hypothetical protein
MPNVLEDLASGIVVTEFDGDTGIATVSNVSGWLFENIGQVNTYLYTNFSGAEATGTYGFMDIEAQSPLLVETTYCLYETEKALLRSLIAMRCQKYTED